MKFTVIIILLFGNLNFCLAQKDSISVIFDYRSTFLTKQKSFLIATDTFGHHFQSESDSSFFLLKLPRNKYYFNYYGKDKISFTDSIDLNSLDFENRYTYTTSNTHHKASNSIKYFDKKIIHYVDADYGLWSIMVGYVNEFKIANNPLKINSEILNSNIEWKGYCCILDREVPHADSIRNEVKKLFYGLDTIKNKKCSHKNNSSINTKIGNFPCEVYYDDNRKFVGLNINLEYSNLLDCYNIYFIFEEYLNQLYENEKTIFTGDYRMGVGKVYYIDDKELMLIYGIKSKNKIPNSRGNNTDLSIPVADNYFIDIEFSSVSKK